MSMMESVAYLKGLAKGLEVSDDTNEGKLMVAIIDVLDKMASSVADVEEKCDELDELVGILDEDLSSVEEDLYDVHQHHHHGDCCGESASFEITCPKCETQLELDLNDLDFDDDDCGCGCGCDCDVDCDCGCQEGQECACGEDTSCNCDTDFNE